MILSTVASLMMLVTGCKDNDTATTPPTTTQAGINKVNHVIVLYLENHSFDNLYGEYPGANGLSLASATQIQVDSAGNNFTTLPMVKGSPFPTNLPNQPFDIDQYRSWDSTTNDLVHRYYQEQQQIDGGRMDKFALISDAKGLSMGYYHTGQLPLAAEAQRYVLCDNFYHSAFGGSFLNHIYLISAAAPLFRGAPAGITAKLDEAGHVISDGAVSPDGYGINTLQTVNTPHAPNTPAANLIPNQTMPTIGDRLSQANISWAWYSGGWDDALAGHPGSFFQFHHQPFAYFANYADGTQAKKDHLKDETDFVAAIKAGTLPSVAFVKPYGSDNEHPGYAELHQGEQHIDSLINLIRSSPIWNDCVIIITYDEHGGFWDHVNPPVIDKRGPGIRVPGIIISPFAKAGYIDDSQYETVSILAFIEKRWGLAPLGTRDAAANPFSNAFVF